MNIAYQSENLRDYYRNNRREWLELYPSERWVFEKLFNKGSESAEILDVGCATGGLARALSEKFSISSYTGVDINPGVIEYANSEQINDGIPRSFFCGDVCDPEVAAFLRTGNLSNSAYSHVIALGCADFNIEPMKIISSCWQQVRAGGEFILSLRLTPEEGVNDIEKSYQYISFATEGATENEEKANYAVFNFQDAMRVFAALEPKPSFILGYGYWGAPSIAARTPHDKVVFSVLSLRKPSGEEGEETKTELHFPLDLYSEFLSK